MCLVLFATYFMVRTPDGRFAAVAGLALAGGLATAALVTGKLARPLGAPMRRIMAGVIAVAGATFVGFLTTVADMIAGKAGLAVLGALCIGAIVWAKRLVAPASR